MDLQENKRNAIAFYETAYRGNPRKAVEYVTMDFFRFDHNGKIVEHWDALQEIPKETLNGHTMY